MDISQKKSTSIEEKLELLKEKTFLVSQKNKEEQKKLTEEIKQILEEAPDSYKGKLFEKYITFLYEGNGVLAKHNGKKGDHGADILLLNNEVEKVDVIVQAKNQKKPLGVKEVRSELIQFEEQGSKIYNCYQYTLISINGFVKGCDELNSLRDYNMKMVSWEYVVKELILTFSIEVLKSEKKKPRSELKAHNQVAYEEILESLNEQNKIAVVRATGTGKSFLITQLLKDYDYKKKLVLAPAGHILDDLKKKFFYRVEENISFLTYQKIIKMSQQDLEKMKFELIIFDEFHRLGAKEWGKFSTRLKEINKNAKMIGFSATPIRFLDNNRDMVEEFFEGQKIEELDLAEAIVRRILPTPTYISSIYTLEEEFNRYDKKIDQSCISNEETKQAKQALNKIVQDWENTYGIDKILAKYLPQTNDNMKFIVFCKNTKHVAEVNIEVQKWFNKALNKGNQKHYKKICPYHIHSKTSDNDDTLKKFEENNDKNTVDLLFCVDMFNEGLHVKGITGVILLRKTSSPTIYYQQIGRALAVGNQDPIIFDLVNNFDSLKVDDGYHFGRALEKASKEESDKRESDGLPVNLPKVEVVDLLEDCKRLFKDINQYLRNSWDFRYQQLKEYFGKHQHCNVPDKNKENYSLGRWVSTQRQAYKNNNLSQERIDLLNQLNFEWDPIEIQWKEMYQQLKEYFDKHEHSNVPFRYEDNPQLGNWVGVQRRAYKNGKLSEERIELLNQLNFEWDPIEIQWKEMYQQLKEYFDKHKNCNVLARCEDNPQLGNWVGVQRRAYKNGKLSEERIELLNQLNFEWDSLESQWKEMYQQLKEYFDKHEHSNVPLRYEDNPRLGSWVGAQRQTHKSNKLSKEKIELLNQLNFEWDSLESQWKEMYQQLQEYFDKREHSNVPSKYEDNPRLGRWINTQRRAYKGGSLSQERIELLNQLNFEWDPFESKWKEMYQQLKEYFDKHQHSNVPQKYKENKSLGLWVSAQREKHRKGKLSQEQIDLLDKLNFDWRN